jgi:UrcA family protein
MFFHAEVKEAGMLRPEFSRYALLSGVATLMAALAPVAAQANDAPMIQKSVTVRVSDLDPSRPDDASKLYARIRRAADNACGDGLTADAPIGSPPDRECVRNAVAAAVSALKQPLVTAMYQHDSRLAGSRAGA